MDNQGNALAGLSFIAFVLLIPPFIWHCRCKNVPAICLMFWLLFLNLTGFINACIWSRADFDEAWDGKGYCDIMVKLEAGSSSGMIGAISALALNLFMVLWAKYPRFMNNGSRLQLYISLGMCVATPVFIMATNYIIQTSRYVIIRYRGCTVTYAPSIITVVLYSMWSLIWSAVAVVFSLLTLIMYFRKRKDVNDILRCTNSGLNLRRFARLLIFSFLVVLVMVPVSIYYFASDFEVFRGKLDWATTHGEYWGHIFFADFGIEPVYDKWVNIALAFVAFILFGLGSDALLMYKCVLCKVGFKRFFHDQQSVTPHLELHHLSKNDSPISYSTFSKMSTQTKINSNRSQISKPMMCHFENEFNEIVDNDDRRPSSSKLKNSSPLEMTIDLEKALPSPQSMSDYFNENELVTKDELNYIINQSINNADDEIDYNYQIQRK